MIIEDIKQEIIILFMIKIFIYYVICLIISYLIGSIPIGVLISKTKGVDIMKEGSCSPGYTNVKRVLGFKYGLIVFILDFLKTIVAIMLVYTFSILYIYNDPLSHINYLDIVNDNMSSITNQFFNNNMIFFSGLGAILGHNYPVFNHFKGGKGITCTVAMCLVFNFLWALILFIIYYMIKKITKYVSLGSIIALIIMFVSAFVMVSLNIYPFNYQYSRYSLPILLVIMLLNIYRHKDNIKRLKIGTENKIK